MTPEELAQIVRKIRAGRQEGNTLDWKRAFWDLKIDESRREFLKDITAMANSLSSTDMRRIIVGVAPQGAIVDAPLPTDEADIQQILGAITPLPSVRFEAHELEGKQVTVVEVGPPFDRP